MTIRTLTFSGLLCLFLATGRSDEPPAVPPTTEGLVREIVKSNATASGKGLGDWLAAQIDTYDFAITAHQAWTNLGEAPDFLKHLQDKSFDPDKHTPEALRDIALKFMEGSGKFTPGTVAWVKLNFSPDSDWEQAYPLYQTIAEERPRDFIPMAVLLFRPVRTLAAESDWYSLLEYAYASAADARERTFCLLALPAHVATVADIPGSESHLQKINRWLDSLEKNETAGRLPALRELGYIRFLVTFAQGDFASAAAHAKGSRAGPLEPLLLVMAGKRDEAKAALEKLNRSDAWSVNDRQLLTSTATILAGTEPAAAKAEKTPDSGK